MKHVRTATLAGVFLAPAVVHAQRGYVQRGSGTDVTGVELGGSVGYGDYLSHSVTTTTTRGSVVTTVTTPDGNGGGLGLHFFVGYRLSPLVSVGARAQYQFIGVPPNTVDCGGACVTSYNAQAYSLGGYVRFYLGDALHLDRVEPFVGVGFDPYAKIEFTSTRTDNRTNIVIQHTDTRSYLAIPLTAGLEYYVTPYLAIGGTLELSPWLYNNDDDCALVGGATVCTGYGKTFASIAFSLRYTFGR